MSELGKRLREEREAREWTQSYLARRAGVAASTIADIESGRSRGSTRILSLALALRLNPVWLSTGRGDKEMPAQGLYVSADTPEELADKLIARGPDEVSALVALLISRAMDRRFK
jgi:transcriptional regulator with XRE-family HTH domain